MTNESVRPTGPRPIDPDYDAVGEAKRLLRATRAGSLATLMSGGHPFVSLVNVATDHDGAPILLLSQLALHTRYLDADPRASILLSQGGKGDPLAHPRLTVIGRARRTEGETRDRLRRRFLSRHPKSALYADFPDFSFWRLEILGAHLNGGFARAADFDAKAISTDLAGADELLAAEEGALAHLNDECAETGTHTGRSPKDKFTVRDATTENTVWWDNNSAMTPSSSTTLLADFKAHAAKGKDAVRAGSLRRRRSGLPRQDPRLSPSSPGTRCSSATC
jgi:putative heme iron utilization protein